MNSRVRASISATLAEIDAGHRALGLSVDPDEFLEAWGVVCRLERKLAAGLDGDKKWRPKGRIA